MHDDQTLAPPVGMSRRALMLSSLATAALWPVGADLALAQADLGPEYYTHPRPAGSTSQPAADGRVYGPGPRVPMAPPPALPPPPPMRESCAPAPSRRGFM